MKETQKIATLFGGSMRDTETNEYKETVLIGNLLAKNRYLIKNGGYFGLMEAVSKGAREHNGVVIGYTCKSFPSIEGNSYLSDNQPCEDIYQRLKNLISHTDLFIVQKGGLGTLSEVALVLDITRKMKSPPKIIVMGTVWKEIFTALIPIMSKKEQKMLTFCENYNEFEISLMSYLEVDKSLKELPKSIDIDKELDLLRAMDIAKYEFKKTNPTEKEYETYIGKMIDEQTIIEDTIKDKINPIMRKYCDKGDFEGAKWFVGNSYKDVNTSGKTLLFRTMIMLEEEYKTK